MGGVEENWNRVFSLLMMRTMSKANDDLYPPYCTDIHFSASVLESSQFGSGFLCWCKEIRIKSYCLGRCQMCQAIGRISTVGFSCVFRILSKKKKRRRR